MCNDEYLLNIDTLKKWNDDELLILASQVFFYLDDLELGKKWQIVQRFSPRKIYDVILESNEQDEKKDGSPT